MIELSVIIPTYARGDLLLSSLAALENQSLARDRYELLVIDDHSPDDTPQRMAQRPSVRYFRQAQNEGPSAARNVGIRAAQGTYLLFLDDDILVAAITLALHLEAHAKHPGANVAILGDTRAAPDMHITPLMRHLMETGNSPLTDSSEMSDAKNVPFGYFQTNTSIARDFVLHAGLYDEEFRFAYGDDTEFAYRLKQHGMRMIFCPEIVVDHRGALSYSYARRRAHLAGKAAILTHRKHPEWIDIRFLRYGAKSRAMLAGKRFLAERVLDPLLLAADAREWDHPALVRACRFSLGIHQLTEMLETAQGEHLI